MKSPPPFHLPLPGSHYSWAESSRSHSLVVPASSITTSVTSLLLGCTKTWFNSSLCDCHRPVPSSVTIPYFGFAETTTSPSLCCFGLAQHHHQPCRASSFRVHLLLLLGPKDRRPLLVAWCWRPRKDCHRCCPVCHWSFLSVKLPGAGELLFSLLSVPAYRTKPVSHQSFMWFCILWQLLCVVLSRNP